MKTTWVKKESLGQLFFGKARGTAVLEYQSIFFKKFGLQIKHLEGLTDLEFSRVIISWNQHRMSF